MPRKSKGPVRLHPEFLKKNGRKEFVVLPYEEFKTIQEQLEDAHDLMTLREAIARDAGGPGLTLDQLKAHLRRPAKRTKRTSR